MSGFQTDDPKKFWMKALKILQKHDMQISAEMIKNPLKTLRHAVHELEIQEEWEDGLMVEIVDENESGTN